jgi:inositol phosphorylceramide mannosyltransferase catalytic subunit
MNTIFLFLLILVLFFIFNKRENFDFEHIPKNYNDEIIDINKSPISGIPKIIHHICPKDYKRWNHKWFVGYESWIRIFPKPEYTHMIWFDDELDQFIEKEFPWFLEVFKSYDRNIKRIDMVRPFFMYKYGGIYADMDYVVYKNFHAELPPDKVSIPESPYKKNEFIQNALMCSPPKHNFWLLIIDNCYKTRNEHVFQATGPQLYTQTYYKYPNLVNILPLELYNPDIVDKDAFNSDKLIAKHLLSTDWGN